MNKQQKLKLSWGKTSAMATELWKKLGDKLFYIGKNTVDIYFAKQKRRRVRADWGSVTRATIFPTRMMKFGPLTVPGPAKPERLLKAWYGTNWQKMIYRYPISHREVELVLEHGFPRELLPRKEVLKVLRSISKCRKADDAKSTIS